MNIPTRILHAILTASLIVYLLDAAVSIAGAAEIPSAIAENAETVEITSSNPGQDSGFGHWDISFDNDILAGSDNDQDYTGGFSLTIAGGSPRKLTAPARVARQWLDSGIGISQATELESTYLDQEAVQIGLLAFTPEDISATVALTDDRPYANLIYLSNSQFAVNSAQTRMIQSTFTLGLIGVGIVKASQNAIHDVLDGDVPQGYSHQISDGGELTARYAVARHSLLSEGRGTRTNYDLKLALEGSVGYLTEATVALGLRWGQIHSPWWSSVSEYADYTAQAAPKASGTARSASRETYFSAGLKVRARAYNSFLQGQFRDSDVTFDSSDLHNLIGEVWLGVVSEYRDLRVSYIVRHQTAELRDGTGARDHTWAGITVARSFR